MPWVLHHKDKIKVGSKKNSGVEPAEDVEDGERMTML